MAKSTSKPVKSAQAVVVNADGSVVRTYNSKEHGNNFKELAKEFAANPVSVQRYGTLTVK